MHDTFLLCLMAFRQVPTSSGYTFSIIKVFIRFIEITPFHFTMR